LSKALPIPPGLAGLIEREVSRNLGELYFKIIAFIVSDLQITVVSMNFRFFYYKQLYYYSNKKEFRYLTFK